MNKLSKCIAPLVLMLTLNTANAAEVYKVPDTSSRNFENPLSTNLFINLIHDHHVWARQHGEDYAFWRHQEHDPKLCTERPVDDFETFVFHMTEGKKKPRNIPTEALLQELIRKRTRDTFHPGPDREPGKKKELEPLYQQWLKEREEKNKEGKITRYVE